VVGRDERELPDVVLRRADPLRECRDLRAVVTEGGANDRRDLRLVLGTLRAEDHARRLNRSTCPGDSRVGDLHAVRLTAHPTARRDFRCPA
jgi:hypothetical protein